MYIQINFDALVCFNSNIYIEPIYDCDEPTNDDSGPFHLMSILITNFANPMHLGLFLPTGRKIQLDLWKRNSNNLSILWKRIQEFPERSHNDVKLGNIQVYWSWIINFLTLNSLQGVNRWINRLNQAHKKHERIEREKLTLFEFCGLSQGFLLLAI